MNIFCYKADLVCLKHQLGLKKVNTVNYCPDAVKMALFVQFSNILRGKYALGEASIFSGQSFCLQERSYSSGKASTDLVFKG